MKVKLVHWSFLRVVIEAIVPNREEKVNSSSLQKSITGFCSKISSILNLCNYLSNAELSYLVELLGISTTEITGKIKNPELNSKANLLTLELNYCEVFTDLKNLENLEKSLYFKKLRENLEYVLEK